MISAADQARERIVQLLTAGAMTELPEKRIRWRDDAVAIADEWALSNEARAAMMEQAHDNAVLGGWR